MDLKASPINPAWIRAGAPSARNALLSTSRDRGSCTYVWDCTPGEFDWHYDTDETIHILQGSIVLDDGCAPPRRLGAGDVVLLPAGAIVHWRVETHVRKLAFFHRPVPMPLAFVLAAAGKLRRVLRRLSAEKPALATAVVAMSVGVDTAT